MLESQVGAVYDAIAAEYADTFRATEPEQPLELAMIDHFVAALAQGAPADPAPRVLDAGCGPGRMLPYLAERGCDVTGIDLSPGMVACAQRDHPEFDVRAGSLTRLPFGAAAFDAYFSWYSTIHLPDDRLAHAFAEARRVLRPGGRLLVAFQAGHGVRDVAAGIRARGHDVVLLRAHRTPDEMAAALLSCGFAESARLVRDPVGPEQDPQAVLIATRTPGNV